MKTKGESKMKKLKLKENQFDLKHGFILELVKHPKGDQYGYKREDLIKKD